MNNNEEKEKELSENIMSDISKSLADQITAELEEDPTEEKVQEDVVEQKKSRFPKWLKIPVIVFSAIFVLGLTGIIVVNAFLSRVNSTDWSDTQLQEEEFEIGDGIGEEVEPEAVVWDKNTLLRTDKDVVNVLLVGEEAIGSEGARGRTDSIMIATINVKQKALKLTSLMRDMYVQIPGWSDNKLNAAYHNGGMPLLKQTIEENFDILIDGSVLVNFDGFETIIDKLGGVQITLTDSEAYYLNTTNYISNRSYRNVKSGTQTLNGNQALGYSRVRYRKASSGEIDDFGRTSRQRTVLNAVFDKYKTKNAAELLLILNDILPLVTTDIIKSDMISYIGTVVTMGATELQTFRLPMDNAFSRATIREMDVLLPDMPANVKGLQEFIFGSEVISKDENSTPSPNATIN